MYNHSKNIYEVALKQIHRLTTENKELRAAALWADEERHKAETENKAQAERIEKLCVENGILWEQNKAWAERIEELKEALESYGSHDQECRTWDYMTSNPRCICTCGFGQALEGKQ